MDFSTHDALEKIFQRVEEESERRAQDSALDRQLHKASRSDVSSLVSTSPLSTSRERRRGSISFSRFGQKVSEQNSIYSEHHGGPRRVSSLASQSAFYKAKVKNGSDQSLATTVESFDEDTAGHDQEDLQHVTQIEQIAAKQTLPKAVGRLIPRRLSRMGSTSSHAISASNNGASVIVGVSIEEATTHAAVGELGEFCTAKVHTGGAHLHPKPSQQSLASLYEEGEKEVGWIQSKAKTLTKKFRRKSKLEITPAVQS